MLCRAGARVRAGDTESDRRPGERLELGRVEVPGDFSSAAPFIVGATLLPGSELIVHDVGLNPTRTGLLDVLARMGARITVINRRRLGGEPVGDLEVHSAELAATAIEPEEVPRLIDELPPSRSQPPARAGRPSSAAPVSSVSRKLIESKV